MANSLEKTQFPTKCSSFTDFKTKLGCNDNEKESFKIIISVRKFPNINVKRKG